jgi:hypothetical protein
MAVGDGRRQRISTLEVAHAERTKIEDMKAEVNVQAPHEQADDMTAMLRWSAKASDGCSTEGSNAWRRRCATRRNTEL